MNAEYKSWFLKAENDMLNVTNLLLSQTFQIKKRLINQNQPFFKSLTPKPNNT